LATPSEEYIKASKLIESFGSFFEKLAQISNNPNQNSQRLTQLKSVLYQNIYSSQDTLNNVLEELCGKQQEPLDKSRQLTKTNSMASINLLESSLRIEPQTPLVSQTPIKSDYASQDFTQMLLSRSEAKQAPAQDGVNQEIHDHSFHTEYLPITNFLSHLKAGSHQETSKLFSMTSNYLHARSFHDQQNSVFTALCFSFFEKVLREKAKDPQNLLPQTLTFKLNEEIQDIDFKETDLLAFLKALPQNITESEMVKKFYEYIPTNPKLHQSLLSIFKEILSKVFPEKQQNISGKHDQFDWFNEIDNNQELSSLQNLTQIFKCAIRFLILNKEKLIEKTFVYDRSQPSSLNSISSQPSITRKDVTIFFDKSTKTSFILYPLRKAYDEDFESPLHQKIKAKITGGVNSRPPLDVGSQKKH